jgi:hypothetical protein
MIEEFKKLYPDYVYSHDDFMLGIDPIEVFISHLETVNDCEISHLTRDEEREILSDDEYYTRNPFDGYEFIRWAMDSDSYSESDKDYYTIYLFEHNRYRDYYFSKYQLDRNLGDFAINIEKNALWRLLYVNEDFRSSHDYFAFLVDLEMYHYINENFHPFIEESPECHEEDKDIWLNKMSA